MTVQYASPNAAVKEIITKLKELSLAFKAQKVEGLLNVELVEGQHKVVGETAILEHILKLEGELHSWYYCDC